MIEWAAALFPSLCLVWWGFCTPTQWRRNLLDKNTAQISTNPTKTRSNPAKDWFESQSTVGIHTSLHDSARWFQRGGRRRTKGRKDYPSIQFFLLFSLLSRVKEENLILFLPERRDFVDESLFKTRLYCYKKILVEVGTYLLPWRQKPTNIMRHWVHY